MNTRAKPEAVIVISEQDNQIALVQERGYKVLYFNSVLDLDDAFRFDVPMEIDLNDEPRVVATARNMAERFAIRAVYTLNEYRVPLASCLASALGLAHHLSLQAALTCRNKKHTKRVLARDGVPTARFALVCTVDEAVAALGEIPLPVVIKPSNDAGSYLVCRCATPDEVRGAVEAILRQEINTVGQPFDRAILLEEYLDGPEFSVEACTVAGDTTVLALTAKRITPWPLTVETGHTIPAPLSSGEAEAIRRLVTRALAALGVDNAVTHTEVKLTPTGPRIIEVNARRGGDRIAALTQAVTGYDLAEVALHVALGGTMANAPRHPSVASSAASRFLIADHDGRVSMTGIDQVAGLPGVRELRLYTQPGEDVERTTSNLNRWGHLITHATPTQHADDVAEEALRMLDFRVHSLAPVSCGNL